MTVDRTDSASQMQYGSIPVDSCAPVAPQPTATAAAVYNPAQQPSYHFTEPNSQDYSKAMFQTQQPVGSEMSAPEAAPISAEIGDSVIGDMPHKLSVKHSLPSSRVFFLLKVYFILLTQLALTFCCIAVNQFVPVLRGIALQYWWIGLIVLVVACIGLIPLYCARKVPVLNLVLLAIWTLTFSWGIGMSLAAANFSDIVVAIGLTFMSVLVLSGSVIVTRADFTRWKWFACSLGVSLFVLSFGTLATVLLSIFVPSMFVWWRLLICVFGALIFSLYIVYDTSVILHNFSEKEYVIAAVTLYLDIINLFLYLLRIVGSKK